MENTKTGSSFNFNRQSLEFDGQELVLLRLTRKASGTVVYLPRILIELWHLDDPSCTNLVGLLDSDSGALVLLRDKGIIDQLRPLLFEARERAAKLKEQSAVVKSDIHA